MVGNADLTGQHGEVANCHAAGDTDLRDNQAVATDRAVVSDLHKIIDLGALADYGIAGGAAVDGRIGADLDVVLDDGPSALWDFLVSRW